MLATLLGISNDQLRDLLANLSILPEGLQAILDMLQTISQQLTRIEEAIQQKGGK